MIKLILLKNLLIKLNISKFDHSKSKKWNIMEIGSIIRKSNNKYIKYYASVIFLN